MLQTGRELEVRQTVALADFGAFRFPEPVHVALMIRRVGGGLGLTGAVAGRTQGDCARCLEPVDLALRFEFDEQFDPASAHDDPLGEGNILHGDSLDVADLVRQHIDSALPIVLACNPDCPGLCPECGRKRDGTCRCTRE